MRNKRRIDKRPIDKTPIEDYFVTAEGKVEDFLNALAVFEEENDMIVSRQLLLEWSVKNNHTEALKAVIGIISEQEIKKINMFTLMPLVALSTNWSEKMEILGSVDFFKKVTVPIYNEKSLNLLQTLLITSEETQRVCDKMVALGYPGILDRTSLVENLKSSGDFETLTELLDKGYMISLMSYNESNVSFELNEEKKLKDYINFAEKLFTLNSTAEKGQKDTFASKFFYNIFSSNLISTSDFEIFIKNKESAINQFVNNKIPHYTYGHLIDINSSSTLFNNSEKAKYILKKAIKVSEELKFFFPVMLMKRVFERKDKENYLKLIDKELPDIKNIIEKRSNHLVESVVYNGSLGGLDYLNSHIGDIRQTHTPLIKDSIEYYYQTKLQPDLNKNFSKEWRFIQKMFLNKNLVNNSFNAFIPDKPVLFTSNAAVNFSTPETWFSIACHMKDKKSISKIIQVEGFDLGINIMIFLNSINADNHALIKPSQISILKQIEELKDLPFEKLLDHNMCAEEINADFEKNKLHRAMESMPVVIKEKRNRL